MLGYRNQRICKLLHKELSILIDSRLKDPTLGDFVSITKIELSKDMRHVKVFVSFLDDSDSVRRLRLLKKASGFLKRELAKKVHLKYLPEIIFHEDKALKLIDKIESI